MNSKTQRLLIWAVVAVGIVSAFALLFHVGRSIKDITPLKDTDWVEGNKNAPVILTEYADFQCPGCKAMHPLIEEAQKDFGDKLAVVFRHFPLYGTHANAMNAAFASEAAGKQGKFWEMHDKLFEGQDFWKDEKDPGAKFVDYADSLGLNKEQFAKDYHSPEVQTKVADMRRTGDEEGISQTPTLFINGRSIAFPQSYEELKQVITKEVEKK